MENRPPSSASEEVRDEDEVHENSPRDPEAIAAQLNTRLDPEGATLFAQYKFEVQARTDKLQASLRQSQAEK